MRGDGRERAMFGYHKRDEEYGPATRARIPGAIAVP
jgi:hypothetical protein